MNVAAGAGASGIEPTTHAAFLRALDAASTIDLCAYSLEARGSVAGALERAGDRGATVSVTLEGAPFPDFGGAGLARANGAVAADLRAHGVRVRFEGPSEPRLHLKAAVVDGAAFLDDRNWPERCDTIVACSTPADVGAVAAAIAGKPESSTVLATEKAAALRLEAAAIATSPGDRIDAETESFGACAVSSALRRRAEGGAHVRLIVSAHAFARATPRERAELARLVQAHVEVRLGGSDEKLCATGDRGWVGSANATFAPQPMLDWGLQTRDRAVIGALERAFARDWRAARPLSG